jgi:apolipoprotein N-acyltransferase
MNAFIAAGVGGLLLALAFPPWDMDLLAWVAFIPLLWALQGEARPCRCATIGAVFGLVFFMVDVRWVVGTLTTHGHFSPLPAAVIFLLMVVFLSLYGAAFGYALGFLGNRGFKQVILAPFVWSGLEYCRACLFTGFPWDLVGYSQVGRPLLIQIADVTGVYGVSFLVILVNGALWELLQATLLRDPGRWRFVGAAACLLTLVVAYGAVREEQFSPKPPTGRAFSVGVLQGNIPQGLKWERAMREHTFQTYEILGEKAVEEGAQLLVWPETAAPVMFGSRDLDWKIPGLMSESLKIPMLIGAPSEKVTAHRGEAPSRNHDGERLTEKTAAEDIHYYNSAFLVHGTRVLSRYDKIHLVPFGEYMPLSWLLPLGPGIAARDADYSAGETMTVMTLPHCPQFSVLICYEAIFPELARLAVTQGAEMLLNITNDGWFGQSAAPYQHLAMARMRSIENRVWLIRAANTGISAAFDPAGRMVKWIPLDKQGFFTVKVSGRECARTFYDRFGDVFVWGCIAICVGLGLATLRRGSSAV